MHLLCPNYQEIQEPKFTLQHQHIHMEKANYVCRRKKVSKIKSLPLGLEEMAMKLDIKI